MDTTRQGISAKRREGLFFHGVTAHAEIVQQIDIGRYKILTDLGLITISYQSYRRAYQQRPTDKSCEILEFRNDDQMIVGSFVPAQYDSTTTGVQTCPRQNLPIASRFYTTSIACGSLYRENNDAIMMRYQVCCLFHGSLALSYLRSLLFVVVATKNKKMTSGGGILKECWWTLKCFGTSYELYFQLFTFNLQLRFQ